MTTQRVVTDEQLGVYSRREHELFSRICKGVIPIGHVLRVMQDLIDGNFDEISVDPCNLIDCDASPFVPVGWRVLPEDQLENRVRGQIRFDASQIELHLDEGQKTGMVVGTELKKRLAGVTVYGAEVLDHLLSNTNLIPDSWKPMYIFFWGTIYRDSDGGLCVRCLYWDEGQWRWGRHLLDRDWGDQYPAAVPAS